MNMATKILQGAPALPKVCTDPITEDSNWTFARGYPTDIFIIVLVKVVPVALTEGKNLKCSRGSPTERY